MGKGMEDSEEKASSNAHGFRKGFQVAEVLYTTQQISEEMTEWNEAFSAVKIDFVKAYEHFNDPEWDGEPLPPDTQRAKTEKDDTQTGDVVYGEPGDTPGGGLAEDGPAAKIVVKLADGKERKIQYIATTTYWWHGRQITAREFMDQLFGDH